MTNTTATRPTRTDITMTASGAWAKIGHKHYRRFDGLEIAYNHNTFRWVVSTDKASFPQLNMTLGYVEHRHPAVWA